MSEQESKCPASGCLCCGKGPVISAALRAALPQGAAGEHFRNASVEFLKGVRELLDQQIQTMSEPQSRGTKLNVE